MDTFKSKINLLTVKIQNSFLSLNDFKGVINELIGITDSPIEHIYCEIHIKIQIGNIDNKYSIGEKNEKEPSEKRSGTLLDKVTSFDYSVWFKNDELSYKEKEDIYLDIINLIEAFNKSDYRDKFGLIALSKEQTTKFADQTVRNTLIDYNHLAIFVSDLDKFKPINDKIGRSAGDEIIVKSSLIMEEVMEGNGIVLHQQEGGDEFIILYPTNTIHEILLKSQEIFKRIHEFDFGFNDLKIGLSIGISTISKQESFVDFLSLQNRAEKIMKPDGEKLRGKYRLECNDTHEAPKYTKHNLNTSVCYLKSNLGLDAPFASPWLNMISIIFQRYFQYSKFKFTKESLNNQADIMLAQIQPDIFSDILISSANKDLGQYYTPIMSMVDVGNAIAHAIFISKFNNSDFLKEEKRIVMQICSNNQGVILNSLPNNILEITIGKPEKKDNELDLGYFVNKSEGIESLNDKLFKRSILVKIGHSQQNFSSNIFSDIVTSDDRPIIGGGLPDFWEATISRLISMVVNNPSVEYVLIIGNKEFANRTIRKLLSIEKWENEIEQLAYKTGQKISNIKTFIQRIGNNIILCENEEKLIETLTSIHKSELLIETTLPEIILSNKGNILTRNIGRNKNSLKKEDGCIVDTIKTAFPLVLEIARKSEGDVLILDQAGQELKELVDFKVILTNPTKNMIPSFYENDSESLENYFTTQFIDTGGLFRKEFEENHQYDVVLDHVCRIINNPKRQYATRRAILVIPHKINNPEDINPLGLVSVRIIMRNENRKIILSYSFTWRTVEALVGFPYSLYGSVRFGLNITEDIKKRVIPEQRRQIEMGEISYVANSLHIFMDEYGQKIAKKIVDEESD